jgi:hypothetical protein
MGKKTASPQGGQRGCICKDGTYNSECCDGSLQAQGIGSMVGGNSGSVTNVDGTRTTSRQNG